MQTNSPSFDSLISTLSQQLADSPPQSVDDPRLSDLVHFKMMSMQLSIAEKLHALESKESDAAAAATRVYRALSLLDRTAARMNRSKAREQAEPSIQREDAMRFLKSQLASGPRPATHMFIAARRVGIAPRTLIRAKTDLGIISTQFTPEGECRQWVWMWQAQSA